LNLERLRIIHYPDPRLRRPAVEATRFDDDLAALARRMLELMHAARGVGLAAPQVGVALRLFVANVSEDPNADQVFVNPVIHDAEGAREAEEGCLSIPDVRVQVRRAVRCRITAQDLSARPVELVGQDLPARVWQHEMDHLNGILILDRMSPSDRIATRRILQELEQKHRQKAAR
jgi:peptide deformylase